MNTSLVTHVMNVPVAVSSLDAYIREVNAVPVLTEAEERELAELWRAEEKQEAAYQLVYSHLRFVVRIARDYMGYGLALGDLIQEGNVGLMKAVKRFDPDKGARLSTFAVYWIKAEIHEYILRNWRIVKIATTKAQRKLFFKLRSTKKNLGWLKQAEISDIAQALNVEEKTVVQMESRFSASDVAFEGHPDQDEETYVAPESYLMGGIDPAEQLTTEDWTQHSLQHLGTALKSLDQRSQEIIQRRWIQEDKATLHELAAEYGVSAERIRQIENNAMKKLKAQLGSVLTA